MEYAKGRIGRVFTVRIDHGDDLILELIKLAELERSSLLCLCCWVH